LKLSIKPRASLLLNRVANFLSEKHIKSYLVGGFVRDLLLNIDSADIDIALASDALETTPQLAEALGGKYVLLDQDNRVARVVLVSKAPDKSKKWHLDFSSFEGKIEQDLERRDFTIDAMAVDLSELISTSDIKLIDPFGGLSDLKQRLIRATSKSTFKQDATRLLRAVRLASELGFSIDQTTETLIRRDSNFITDVAGERVREELLRLLILPEAGSYLSYLDELGILTNIIPELAQSKGVEQPKEHFWDVFEHSIKTVAAISFLLREGAWEYVKGEILSFVPWSGRLERHFDQGVSSGSTRRSLLKLAALLHDISKPQTKTIDPDGRMRFLGHAKEGAKMVAGILERLRFSSKEMGLIKLMVEHHLRPAQLSQEGLPTRRAIYRYFRDCDDASIDTLFLSLADHLATRGQNLIPTQGRVLPLPLNLLAGMI